jgi:hypothetical protein
MDAALLDNGPHRAMSGGVEDCVEIVRGHVGQLFRVGKLSLRSGVRAEALRAYAYATISPPTTAAGWSSS